MADRPHSPCEVCRFHKFAKNDPYSLLGWFWTWHTKWCPGWKSYVKGRRQAGEGPPEIGSDRGLWDEKK
ncbi:hypothetical protein [Salidesulfovibrio onnuriiensis]|uniref:hypothetical protein n=1 Tax=Salidesulfovibrio onnuriiensis TaxID=2583823 RepID=UPI0011C7FD4C|nr:hypothetical protein [Salidesulfovibrio onnuriiensis]